MTTQMKNPVRDNFGLSPKSEGVVIAELTRKGYMTAKGPNGYYNQRNDAQKKMQLGAAGEKIVRFNLTQLNMVETIQESLDPFDSVKDFTFTVSDKKNGIPGAVPGKEYTAEIKTMSPYYNIKSFSFRTNQLKKLTEVDYIFFLATPSLISDGFKNWPDVRSRKQYMNYNGDQACEGFAAFCYIWDNNTENIKALANAYAVNDPTMDKKPMHASIWANPITQSTANREMFSVPIAKLLNLFYVEEPKQLVVLDKLSTDRLGLKA